MKCLNREVECYTIRELRRDTKYDLQFLIQLGILVEWIRTKSFYVIRALEEGSIQINTDKCSVRTHVFRYFQGGHCGTCRFT